MGGDWTVHSCSSESPVHKTENVLLEELYRIWQTNEPSEEAWLILQAHPPKAFHRLEIVNAGASLIELYGLPEQEHQQEQEHEREHEQEYELLLSTQQVMTLKDLTNKSNRNRSFTYAIPQKLSPLAAQKRWKKLRIVCRQPFGTSQHRACIGLSRIDVISCNTVVSGSQSIVETSKLQEVKKACSADKPMKRNNNDSSTVTCSTKIQSMNEKDVKHDVRKPKLPSWNVTTENSEDDSPNKSVVHAGPSEERQGKQIPESSEGNGKDAANGHMGKAGCIESIGGILSSVESKTKSFSSPKTAVQQKKRNKLSDGKEPANNLVISSPSDRSILSGSGAEDEETGPSQRKPDHGSFATLLDGVVFAISGLVNPERGDIRSQALEMGAEYQPDWNPLCTLLVCAFPNTPKFRQVKDDCGTIVSKEWILECYKQRKLVDIDRYLMHAGKPWRKMQSLIASSVSERTKKKLQLDGETVSPRTNKGKNVDAKSNEKLDFIPVEVQKWAVEDLNATVAWLQEQKEKPEPSALEETAIQGIMTCLEDTENCLAENKPLHNVLDNWEFIPRVVKELAALEHLKKGSQKISRDELCKRANTLKKIYESVFRKVIQQNKEKVQKEYENTSSEGLDRSKAVLKNSRLSNTDDHDSAIDTMPADASKGNVESDDDTIVMGEDELDEAEAEVSKKYSQN